MLLPRRQLPDPGRYALGCGDVLMGTSGRVWTRQVVQRAAGFISFIMISQGFHHGLERLLLTLETLPSTSE